uniref:S100/CaBP-9k-type calcium binding subdomain domain-containing protein n=1 Tax=Salmo trutta TaxID=8032 RepID=A0A674CV87_SALTR
MAQPTPLEASLGALIMAFHKHAGSGDAKTLSKKANQPYLVSKEGPEQKGGPEGDDLMTMLDQDGALNFMEYLTLIVSLACMCNCVLEGKMCSCACVHFQYCAKPMSIMAKYAILIQEL